MLHNTIVYNNILETIGNTPMVELKSFDTGLCRLFVKLENQNPGGSIKDRIALSMIRDAEEKGRLKPGGTIVEATAGNTGIGLTLVAKMKGYFMVLVIPDKMSQEKINHLRAMGAEIIITRSDVEKGHPAYYQDLAQKIADERGAYYINQFENPANPHTHIVSTGPEIWSQLNCQVDAIVAGIGSSGTITGLSRFFKQVNPDLEMILADPQGSILAEYVNQGAVTSKPGSWHVEGIGEDFIPLIADLGSVKKAYSITDQESFDSARDLLRKEGILAGSSSGTLLAAAIKYCQEQKMPKNVVSFVCDSGNKYLSKMYNDVWLSDRNMLTRKQYGDLRDVISRRYEDDTVVSVSADDPIDAAFAKMKRYDISQLPVMEGEKVLGLLDESDLLYNVFKANGSFGDKVSHAMSENLITVSPNDSIESLVGLFKNGYVAIVTGEKGQLYGIITQIDLIHFFKMNRVETKN